MDDSFLMMLEKFGKLFFLRIPISPDIMFYISASESLKLLNKKFLINTVVA